MIKQISNIFFNTLRASVKEFSDFSRAMDNAENNLECYIGELRRKQHEPPVEIEGFMEVDDAG